MTYNTWQEAIILVPEHMRQGVTRYIESGIPGGNFMMAVFENDLIESVQRADWVNKQALPSWAEFLMYAPSQCYGSPPIVDRWVKRGGLIGISKEQESKVG